MRRAPHRLIARPRARLLAAPLVLLLAIPATAGADALSDPADQWLPSADGATWTYSWSDGSYAPKPTTEKYTFSTRSGTAFRLAWTTTGQGNPGDRVPEDGVVDYNRTDAGLVNLNWSSVPPPPQFPVLCAQSSGCPNSLAASHFMIIWGSRAPVLIEPLLAGTRWSTLGGASNDVSSDNRYLGVESVVVPAFPKGVAAAKVQSDITQAGALGDPWGSALRTVWWVRGVGPVKIALQHTGGDFQQSVLVSTNLTPRPAPPDTAYLPLNVGQTLRFRYRNSRYLRTPSTQQFTVSQVVNNTARVDVKSLAGPIHVAGSYVFSTRLSGITNLSAFTRAATKARFPTLGPISQPRDRRRHFFTPLDLMTFGFNPVLTAYPAPGQSWSGSPGGRDYQVFGVQGATKVLGTQTVSVPAGRFQALEVRSDLTQAGSRFGSGRRTSYFAPGRGLVKLVFRHRDGSVSTVERLP